MTTPELNKKGNFASRSFAVFLATVEWLGNLLPHPVTLFALFALTIILVSGIADWLGWQVTDPRPADKWLNEEGTIVPKSLMNAEGLRWITQNLVNNFTGFAPLGTVLVALLGVGVAERSGLLNAVIRGLILAAPKTLVTMVLVFAGVVSNTASEMGYVVIIPLGMVIFHSLGRHPMAGLAAAFAGVSGGYSANILIGTVDPLLAGITQEAARVIDSSYEVHPAVNWYFMIVSTFLITIVGTWVTAKIVEPRLGSYDISNADDSIERDPSLERLTTDERRALRWTGVSVIAMILALVYLAGPHATTTYELPAGTTVQDVLSWDDAERTAQVEAFKESGDRSKKASIQLPSAGGINDLVLSLPLYGALRDPGLNSLVPSPFLRSIVAFIFVCFVIPGFVYGWFVGTMRTDRDVIDAMAQAMSSMGLYIVLVFFAAQFVEFFKITNLGMILAVVGADVIRDLGLDNPLVFIPFILMCCFVNLMLGSASAQWAVTAPIFVPMLMQVGYSPEVIQAAYRIGDSTTNIITPMMSYFGLILAFAAKYDRKLGIGTLIATMLPYCIFFLIGWMILFYAWVFWMGFPVGPGAPTYYPAG